jgi:hypothetical protein
MKQQQNTFESSVYPETSSLSIAALADLHKNSIYQSIYSRVHNKFLADEIFSDVCMAIINTTMAGIKTNTENFLPRVMQIVQQRCSDALKKAG